MMTPIKHMFGEVQYELVKILLLNVFLSTVILFLIADLVALIFNMPIWYVIVISFVYFVIILWYEMQKISVKQVEKNNPELSEILRTAKDNQSEDTLMSHALFHEVLDKMKRVSGGTFIDFKQLMVRLSTIFALAIVLISIAFFDVNIARFDNPLERPISALSKIFGGAGGLAGDVEGTNVQDASDDVFGEASIAKLGDDQLVATVNPSLNSPDFTQIGDPTLSGDPLTDLSSGDARFNTPGENGNVGEGLNDRDLQRSYNYAKSIQENP